MALTLRYFNEFGKSEFQLITASSSIELIDQKSASITYRAVKLVCETIFAHSRVKWISALLTFNLSFTFRLTVVMVSCSCKHCDSQNLCASLLYFVVRVRCRRKRVHVRYLIYWWASCWTYWSVGLGLFTWVYTPNVHFNALQVCSRGIAMSQMSVRP